MSDNDGTLLLDGLILASVDERLLRREGNALLVKLSGRALEYLIEHLYPFYANPYNWRCEHRVETARLEFTRGELSPDAPERHREWGHLIQLDIDHELWRAFSNKSNFQREDEEMQATIPLLILDEGRDDRFTFRHLGKMGANCTI